MQNVKKTYKLFLDDIREPIHAYEYTRWKGFLENDWEIVRSYEEFVQFIEDQHYYDGTFPEIIAFDHDLADEHYGAPPTAMFQEKTGYDCSMCLFDFCIEKILTIPSWICHSMNPVGRDNINIILKNYKKFQKNG